MRFYLAPLEGITGFIFRNAYFHHFGRMDRYFTPFIPTMERLSMKIERDLLPENNQGMELIPQLIVREPEEVLKMMSLLRPLGYSRVNLNMGCPAGTVVAKGRGAGMLADPEALDIFFTRLFHMYNGPVSVKTRIGLQEPGEWEALLAVYRKYPFEELIIHPRLKTDKYLGQPRLEAFRRAAEEVKVPLCYNGDIYHIEDFQRIRQQFPGTDRIMLGRGVLRDPFLVERLQGETPADKSRIWDFLEELMEGYLRVFKGEVDAIYHIKEIWSYLQHSFPGQEKLMKKIRKARNLTAYREAVADLRRNVEE